MFDEVSPCGCFCGFCLVHCITKEYAKTNLILIKLEHVLYFDFGCKYNTFA